jgi:hypothetical protein
MSRHHTDDHPTRNEDEYFARENAELVKQMRARLDAERQDQERRNHFMKCPKCGADLGEKEFGHVKGEMDLLRQMDSSRGAVSRIMNDILGIFQPKTGESSSTKR